MCRRCFVFLTSGKNRNFNITWVGNSICPFDPQINSIILFLVLYGDIDENEQRYQYFNMEAVVN